MSDRTVFVRCPRGGELVRYDRAGKWRWEDGEGALRLTLNLASAVEHAINCTNHGGEVIHYQPGGRMFYARLRCRLGTDR